MLLLLLLLSNTHSGFHSARDYTDGRLKSCKGSSRMWVLCVTLDENNVADILFIHWQWATEEFYNCMTHGVEIVFATAAIGI